MKSLESLPAANPDPTAFSETVSPIASVPTDNLGWSVFKNSVVQIAGRLFISLSRLIVTGLIIRGYGKDVFGRYSLVFGFLAIADWLVDFGTTDVFVRDISSKPDRGTRLMRVLTAAKLVQVPASFAALAAILLILKYPHDVLEAGLVGGAGLIFFGGVIAYKVVFRVALTMERDVAAELLSIVAVIPLIALICRYGGGLIALAACQVISRGVYLGVCYRFGRKMYRPSIQGVAWRDIGSTIQSCAAIGVIGFLVGGYETLDILLLSKFGDFSQLAYYSGAQRLVWPVLMALSAVAATFFPVIASYWPDSRQQFERACQRSLDIVVTLAGFVLCSAFAGAEFFMGLLGPDLKIGAPALRVLALLCFVKAISSSVGPVFYVVKAQRMALQFIAFAVVLKVAVIAVLAPRYGYMGVAYSALVVEACVAAAAVILIRRAVGYRVRWNIILKVASIAAASAVVPWFVFSRSGFPAAVTAPLMYVPLVFVSGAVNWSEMRSVVRWNR
jgi:O-antigen/teichoic acid export membrane protein